MVIDKNENLNKAFSLTTTDVNENLIAFPDSFNELQMGHGNGFLLRRKVAEQLPYSVAIQIKNSFNNETNPYYNNIYIKSGIVSGATIVEFDKNAVSSGVGVDIDTIYKNRSFNTINEISSNAGKFSWVLNSAFETLVIDDSEKDSPKNEIVNIKMLINEIKITESQYGQRDAMQHLLSFLFDSINEDNFEPINSLIQFKDTLSLKYLYLICIVNITYRYKDRINNYSDFLDSVKSISKNEMTERNFDLTFRNFK